MFKTLANAWKVKDLRSKLLFTIMIILLYRIGAAIVVPFVDASKLTGFVQENGALNFMNLMSGGAFATGSLFALGVQPYITASIVMQLLSVAIPPLERLAKQGEEGKQKITVITRYVTVGVALLTAIGYYMIMKTQKALTETNIYYAIVIIACYCAGSSLVMWLAEKINDKGIGNGISMILFANIVSRFRFIVYDFIIKIECIIAGSNMPSIMSQFGQPYSFSEVLDLAERIGADGWKYRIPSILVLLITTLGMLALIWFVIFISDSERRIPVQYAKKVVGRKMYGGRNTNLPIKLNMTGVMPVIFASSILMIPSLIIQLCSPETDSFWYKAGQWLSSGHWFYATLTFILILAFAYFYVAISFNPVEVAGNLQKNGGSIPGIRPGKATSMFIKKVLSKVTLIGALALSVIAVLPMVIYIVLNAIGSAAELPGLMGSFSMLGEFVNSGTSVIIVVGVVLELVRELEAQMTMRHYKGFLD